MRVQITNDRDIEYNYNRIASLKERTVRESDEEVVTYLFLVGYSGLTVASFDTRLVRISGIMSEDTRGFSPEELLEDTAQFDAATAKATATV